MTDDLPIWAEIDVGRIKRNVGRMKGLLQGTTRLLTVVKAGGYGHGDVEAARAAVAGGADWLGVARVQEGQALREAGLDNPVLLLAEPPAGAVPKAVELDLTPTLYTQATAEAFSKNSGGRRVAAHIKVDTGMHRYGVLPQEATAFWDFVAALPGLKVDGVWSHFACAEDVSNPFTRQQYVAFLDVLEALGDRTDGVIRHLANSAATMTFPEAHFDMVRSGIAAYGLYPSPALADRVPLEPAMALKSRVGLVKKLPAGEPISYGQKYAMPKAGFVATVPCGYADGLKRGATNNGQVLIRGRRYPICGSVTMDHFLVDAGDDEPALGDEVVILGAQGDDEITAQEVADRLGTIPYEIVCGISARVARIYRGGP